MEFAIYRDQPGQQNGFLQLPVHIQRHALRDATLRNRRTRLPLLVVKNSAREPCKSRRRFLQALFLPVPNSTRLLLSATLSAGGHHRMSSAPAQVRNVSDTVLWASHFRT